MSVYNFQPRVWSNYVITQLNKTHVFAALANRNFQGTIAGAGSSVVFPQIGRLSATAYTGANITPQELQDAASILQVNRPYESSFQLDDVDAAQVSKDYNLIELGTKEGVYAIRNEVDAYIGGLYADAGLSADSSWTDSSPLDVTSLNIVDAILAAGESLDVANVPREVGRYMVAPPWFMHKLALAGIINLDNPETAMVWTNGFVGTSKVLGFEFYMSNNVSIATPSTGAQTRVIYGVKGQSFAYAEQIMSVEATRRELTFKDLVKMLILYGAKVLRPDMTGILYCDKTAEA